MSAFSTDPIVAIATAPGRGGIGVLRLSGPDLADYARRLFGRALRPRHAHYLPFKDRHGETMDEGLALFFPGPHSYTGEDVLELQGHGGPAVLRRVLEDCLARGADIGLRLAQPGEFTQRAFLNDRRVRVSTCVRYHDALLASHIPQSTALPATSPFVPLLAESAAARRTGSTVLDLAWVSSGRLDGFCGVGLKPWDMAAGSLLVLEAGGLMADFQGEQGWMETGNVLAAPPKIFAQMMAHLRA